MSESWFGVRCLFRLTGFARTEGGDPHVYEERVTLWQAASLDEAIALAETEAADYADAASGNEYLGLAQANALLDEPIHGAEVFSLLRESPLRPDAYLDAFFDTGTERQQLQ